MSFIPRTPETGARELMTDLGKFNKNTKIKCGKLLVQSRREHVKKPKHIEGTPRMPPVTRRDDTGTNKQNGPPTDYSVVKWRTPSMP